jgi:short-subunit dehydrogenase
MKKRTIPAVSILAIGVAALICNKFRRHSRLGEGQVAIITGGSSGLGLALAHRFGRAGLKLVLAARSRNDLEEAKKNLLSARSLSNELDIVLVACDLSDQERAASLIHIAIETFGRLDILINNAGIIEVGPMEDQPLQAYECAMAVNFFAALYTSYAALPIFLKRRSGAIVNISSIGGKVAVPHLLPYVASKFALTGFSEGMHAELRHKGVQVTTVCPGLMRTGGETHAHFRGQVEKEKAWFQTSARTPLLAASATYVAEQIFAAVDAGRAELTITPQAWLAARFAGVAPETTQFISSLVNAYLLPQSSRPMVGNPQAAQPARASMVDSFGVASGIW